ncbi:Fic family protein [Butyricicoccus sp.]|uniref:Fic family protein n=1 Tax=Butyricicoccus sp. TaxID=2049021 RepID=UPI003D7D96FE
MRYEPLGKLYYKSRETYETVYAARYHDVDVIRLDFTVNENPAFLVPNTQLWTLITEILRIDKRVAHLRSGLPGIALEQFSRRCLVDEIVLTNDIEGVNSTRREIHEVLEKLESKEVKQKKRFDGLVRQYLRLRKAEDIPLTNCQELRDLYNELVLPDIIQDNPADCPDGQYFRKEAVSVMSPSQKEIHRGVQPESKIIEAMEQALRFLNDDSVEILIRISVFHYLFGYIHPFYDGNGRLSRFISSYLLSRTLDPLVSYRLSYTIKENIRTYYDSFKLCNDRRNRGDITPFVLAFLDIIAQAMHQLEYALEKRTIDLQEYRERMQRDSLLSDEKYQNLTYILLQAALFSDNGISEKELRTGMHLSYATVKKRLNALDEHQYLLTHTRGREKLYQLDIAALEKLTN